MLVFNFPPHRGISTAVHCVKNASFFGYGNLDEGRKMNSKDTTQGRLHRWRIHSELDVQRNLTKITIWRCTNRSLQKGGLYIELKSNNNAENRSVNRLS